MATKIQNKDEDYFVWWANELIKRGYAKDVRFEPVNWIVQDAGILTVEKFMKRGDNQFITKKIFNELTWTVDFCIDMHRSLEGKMFLIIDDETPDNRVLIPDHFDKSLQDIYLQTCLMTTKSQILDDEWVRLWLDVKPPAHAIQFSGSLGSSRDFKYLQRLMFERNKIYVNKVVMKHGKDSKNPNRVNTLFNKTFLPERYLYNDVDLKPRKLKNHEQVALSINQYLKSKGLDYNGPKQL